MDSVRVLAQCLVRVEGLGAVAFVTYQGDLPGGLAKGTVAGMSYRAEHHELQAILTDELQEYGPHPLSPKDADAVAWHLADVTLRVVISAVERERSKGSRR